MPYMNVTEVESALTALNAAHPALCELITLPNVTHEGRTSHAIRIAKGPLDSRPAMLFIGGQHAREWGSCEICINVAADLIEAYNTNSGLTYGGKSFTAAHVKSIIEQSQIFVFACVNPDGRNHSQTVSAMWRKNRNPVNPVDPNRNYDVLWDFSATFSPLSPVSVSDIPSSDTYHGTAPFSEPETRNVRWLLDTYPQIRWMIDIHSYSRLLYHNWGDDENQIVDPAMNFRNAAYHLQRGVSGDAYREYIRPGDQSAEKCLVERMRDALQAVRGQTYSVGQTFALYPTSGTATDYPYSRHWVDATKTKTLGFLIEWGTEFQPPWAEMENIILDVSSALVEFAAAAPCTCSTIDLQLLTATIAFNSVPENELTFRAAVFRVTSCRDVHLEIKTGPTVLSGPAGTTFGTPLGTVGTAPGVPSGTSDGRVWISYRGTSAGDHATGTVTIRCQETGEEWVIPITADTIARPAAAAILVFDQSNSMNFASGIAPGVTRAQVLRFSAPPFVEVVEDINALGIIAFDQDPHDRMAVTPMDLPGRLAANGHISGYAPNPNGWTSIGEGLARARDLLTPVAGYAIKAIVVLTDGQENHDGYARRYIADVAASIDSRVYAIGLGTAENLQPAALEALCNGHEGYLLMTGALDTSATFRLAKYYQQILAGVTNQDIIVDPDGTILPGQVHRIPFDLNEADITADVIVLTPAPGMFDFRLETPGGDVIDPAGIGGNPAITFTVGTNVSFYRVTLPVPLTSSSAHAGRWHAIISIDKKYHRHVGRLDTHGHVVSGVSIHGVPYSLTARAWSDINMRASVSQNSHEPHATMIVRAVLTEYDVPVEGRASVQAELARPDHTQGHLVLHEVEPGIFEASVVAAIAGVYRFRVLASGMTFHHLPFTREQIVTAAVWRGGDHPPPPGGQGPDPTSDWWCRLLRCLLRGESVRERLKREGLDVEAIERCLKAVCQDPRHRTGEGGVVRQAAQDLRIALADARVQAAIQEAMREMEDEVD
jgi:murein tripeptide amidase MpaA